MMAKNSYFNFIVRITTLIWLWELSKQIWKWIQMLTSRHLDQRKSEKPTGKILVSEFEFFERKIYSLVQENKCMIELF